MQLLLMVRIDAAQVMYVTLCIIGGRVSVKKSLREVLYLTNRCVVVLDIFDQLLD